VLSLSYFAFQIFFKKCNSTRYSFQFVYNRKNKIELKNDCVFAIIFILVCGGWFLQQPLCIKLNRTHINMGKITYIIYFMFLSILFHSAFYIINLSSYLILLKYMQITYQYDNFWFTTLLSVICAPFYLFYLTQKPFRNRIHNYGTRIIFPIVSGLLYSIESIMLYYSINDISLSYYTILRSSFVIWNIPFFIFVLKKKIGKIYLTGCVFLLVCYSLIIFHYLKSNMALWKPSISILISCSLNSIYNCIIEYSMKKYDIFNIDYQIIFQMSYFFSAIIPSVIKTVEDPPPCNLTVVALSALIAVSIQTYFYNKIKILENKNEYVPSNVLMSGLDLIRRIVLLLFAFTFFHDDFNESIIISILFFIGSGICMLLEYVIPVAPNSQKYVEMEELSV
jgi:drug/metabolite transporter (DMT)-like permease